LKVWITDFGPENSPRYGIYRFPIEGALSCEMTKEAFCLCLDGHDEVTQEFLALVVKTKGSDGEEKDTDL
jgi:hypothetical protein